MTDQPDHNAAAAQGQRRNVELEAVAPPGSDLGHNRLIAAGYAKQLQRTSSSTGLATMLLRAGERRLRERGAVRLTAIVADDETDAMRFWRAAGYERQQHRARFVSPSDGD